MKNKGMNEWEGSELAVKEKLKKKEVNGEKKGRRGRD